MNGFVNRVRGSRLCRGLGWVSLPFFPLFCWAVLEYFNFRSLTQLAHFVLDRPKNASFGMLTAALAFVLALLLFRRAAAACGVMGGVFFALAYVNYMKLALNGDHLFPKDFAMVGQAGALLSFLSGGLPKWMGLALCVLILWCVALGVLGIALPRRGGCARLFAAASIIALCAVFCAGSQRVLGLLARFSIQIESTGFQNGNYVENGFLGAFAMNLQSMRVQPPPDYSEHTALALLADSKGRPAVRENFDVILVLSESFFDLRELPGLTFSQNPLSCYDRLLDHENCYSGRLYTNAIGGGTVRPEFEILTGLDTEVLPSGTTPYEYVSRPLEGYVSNYKDAGYQAIALHPYIGSFYARDRAYPCLGFDAFYAHPELEQMGELTYKREGYVSDESLERIMEDILDGSQGPMFLFAITMENHQPFNPLPEEEILITVTSDRLDQSTLGAVTTYAQGLYDADRMLGRLAEYIDGRERPTVLIFYGDHKATLGPNLGAYDQTGLFPAQGNYSPEYRKIMYSTPFLIYANRELDPGLFASNWDNELSTYYLLDAAALCTGFQTTPYMERLLEHYPAAPYYNSRLAMPLTPELEACRRLRELVTYDRLLGKNYTSLPIE